MKTKDYAMGITVILAGSVWLNVWLLTRKPEVTERVETKTEYITVRDSIPKEEARHETGGVIYVTIPSNSIGTSAQMADTVAVCHDTAPTDSVVVALPEEQAVYSDSLYTAWVSGYRPRLDSIHLRLPHTTTTITMTETAPAPRLVIGPTIGAGYGIGGRRADVFVGISVTYNLWRKRK